MSRRYHLQFAGLVYIGLAVLVGVAATNRPNNLLVWVFGIMLSAVVLSGIVSGLMMLGVRVTRLDPRHGRVGEPLVVRYTIRNHSRVVPLFNIHVEERSHPGGQGGDWSGFMEPAPAWVLHAGPGETVHGEAVMWPSRRGVVRFDRLRAWSTFPFGLLKKSVAFSQAQETLVYPQVHTLRPAVLRAVTPGGFGGARVSRRSGQGEDYYGTREYKPGDSIRQIAWKRGAGLDQLVSIERTQPSPPRVRVVLNLLRPTAALRVDAGASESPRDLEEEAISLAASLLALADAEGYEIGLSILGLREDPTPLRRGHWHLQKLMAMLARIDLDAERVPRGPAPVADAERAGLIVVSPDRAEPSLVGEADGGAWHLSARQLPVLLAGADSTGGTAVEPASPAAEAPA